MQGGKPQSGIRPVALGATVNSGCYGSTIPLIYGQTKGAMYLIWMANIRLGSGKKAKKSKGAPDYVANTDWLICHNPAATILQSWVNQNQWLILNFVKYTTEFSFTSPASFAVPDPHLYAVVAVTVTVPYYVDGAWAGSVTFDDYGAQGPSTLTGSYEVPLWNAAYSGPDPAHSSACRNNPFAYWWTPANGATIELLYGPLGTMPIGGWDLNVYYAQVPNFDEVSQNILQTNLGLNGQKSNADTPIGALNLVVEQELGDGPEFFGVFSGTVNPLSDEQIVYPHYFGAGSESFAMGSTQTFPQVSVEVEGAFPVNPSGSFTGIAGDGSGADADFADIVEDLFYGATQAGFGADNPQTPIQHGLNCAQNPRCVQQANYIFEPTLIEDDLPPWFYPLPNVAGNWLVVIATQTGSAELTISDADFGNNTWTPVFAANNNIQIWYAQAKAFKGIGGKGTTVSVSNSSELETGAQVTLLEISGVDTIDAVIAAAGNSASITTSGAQATPMYILAYGDFQTSGYGGGAVNPQTLWQYLLNPDSPSGTVPPSLYQLQSRIVQFPGTYKYTAPSVAGHAAQHVALLAFKCSQPPNYPPAYGNVIGDILDKPSLQIVRNQCRAAGLVGSLCLDSQVQGSDIIGQLYEAMDAWPVWSGFSLKSIARSEVSAVGNGAVYNAPTAPGPVVDLVEADFNTGGQSDTPPVTVTRKAQVNVPDILSVQHPNRASQYNQIVVSQPESGAVALYGPRKDSPKTMNMFQSPAVSRMYLDIQVRLANYVRNQYEFPLVAKWKLLEPGDLITIPQSATMPAIQGPGGTQPVPYVKIPLRVLTAEEDEKFGIKITAEPFIYGTYAPLALPATAQQGYIPQTGGNPGSVNPPVIFEPVPRLAGGNTQNELWLAVSGGATEGSPPVTPDYGGCFVYVSTDGGNSYNPVAPITSSGSVVGGEGSIPSNAILGNGITGYLTEGWPAAPSPDSTNDLFIDLSESHGELESYSVEEEDAYTYPCYVGGGATSPEYQQSCSTYGVGVGSASKVFSEDNNAGNTIFVIVGAYQDEPLGINVTDENLNDYQLLGETDAIADFGPYSKAYVYGAVNVAGGANEVTVTFQSGTGDLLFAALEYSDIDTIGSPPDAVPFTSSFSQTTGDYPLTVPTGAFAVTIGGGLILAFAFDKQNNTDTFNVTPSLGWNLREDPTGPTGGFDAILAVWDAAAPNPSAQAVTIEASVAGGGDSGGFHVGALAFQPSPTAYITGIPYELMTYAVAELTGPYQYTLKATPSGSPPEANHLDRGVFGAPAPNQGVFHDGPGAGSPPIPGSRFAFVGPPYPGIMKIALDPSWIGKTLFFKFAAFNSFIAQVQSLADCTAYAYTPNGAAGSASGNPASYTVTPTNPTSSGSPPVVDNAALSNPTATSIDMAQVTVQFPSNAVTYNARTFTIPDPAVPTTYYVTITDPGYVGDAPGQTNLTAICQTSDALVGVPGNTYIGSIVAEPGGGGTITTPGGSSGDSEFVLLVNGE